MKLGEGGLCVVWGGGGGGGGRSSKQDEWHDIAAAVAARLTGIAVTGLLKPTVRKL